LHTLYFPIDQIAQSNLIPNCSDLSKFSKILYEIACKNGREIAKIYMEEPETFFIYHSAMEIANQRWAAGAPAQQVVEHICDLYSDNDFVHIADCGCGYHATLAVKLQEKCNDLHIPTKYYVHGIDFGQCRNPMLGENVYFQFEKNDYIHVIPSNPYDVIVFCISLMCGDNITEEIIWSYKNLKKGGRVFIVEPTHRFVPQFLDLVKWGFNCTNIQLSNHFSLVILKKKNDTISEQPPQIILNCLYQ